MGMGFECCTKVVEARCVEYGIECMKAADQAFDEVFLSLGVIGAISLLGLVILVLIVVITSDKTKGEE